MCEDLSTPDQLNRDLKEGGRVTLIGVDRNGQQMKVVTESRYAEVRLVPTVVILNDPWEDRSIISQFSLRELVEIEIEQPGTQMPIRWLRRCGEIEFLRLDPGLEAVVIPGYLAMSSHVCKLDLDEVVALAKLEAEAEAMAQIESEKGNSSSVVTDEELFLSRISPGNRSHRAIQTLVARLRSGQITMEEALAKAEVIDDSIQKWEKK